MSSAVREANIKNGDNMAKRTATPKDKRVIRVLSIALSIILVLTLCFFAVSSSELSEKILLFVNKAFENIPENPEDFSAHFINVGQGDCTLLKCRDDVVLIDCGEAEAYSAVEAYLDSRGINEIDYFILSHFHSDHVGGAEKVLENYKVKNIIMTRLSEENTPTTQSYKNLLEAIKYSGASVYAARPGDEYKLDNFSFNVIGPNKNYDELNNSSVVISARYGENSFLFTGDAEYEAELDMLKTDFNLSADVLKLGHHGSDTSSSDAFLEAVNPRYAVISCGLNNSYNHPDKKIIDKLASGNIKYYRTDTDGNIIISSDKKNISVYTQGENRYG